MKDTENTTTINENIQVNEPQEDAPQLMPRKHEPRPLFGHSFGILDYVSFAVALGCTVANRFINRGWLTWALVGVCLAGLATPAIIQKIKMRNTFGLGSILRLFKKMGMNPVADGDEIRWSFQGKENVIRLVNGNQLQICREYPAQPEIISKFSCAATVTMNEIFSAKVGIRERKGLENIVFSTEMICSSMKEFTRILPESVCILDAAEDRQRENLKEILNSDKPVQRKIGFNR